MRKIKILCSVGIIFACCAPVALIALATGSAVAEAHLPSSASDSINLQKLSPSPRAERVTTAPKTTKGAPDFKPLTPLGGSRISDGR
ncbi:MAG: hypothetical protein FJX16_07010 [Alphaproteobacteria bacterium]|nr:hypothetical protein [Alphaproteobacteria bacterium]MBM3625055.1 hypothetical protein [Alphaproteobacteria bacterium]